MRTDVRNEGGREMVAVEARGTVREPARKVVREELPGAVGIAEPIPDLSAQPAEWIEAEVCTLAGHIAAATCRLLLLIAELDRREAWRTWECHSCAHWLSWRVGMSMRTARDHVRVAAALRDLPETTSAFAAGRLSYSKVRAITRCATPKTEADLVAVAIHATAAQMDQIASGYCRSVRLADPEHGAGQLRRRGMWSHPSDDGTTTLVVRGSSDEIRRILEIVRAAERDLPELVDEPDEPAAARRYEALVHVAQTYLDPDGHAPPSTELVVHADAEALLDGEPGRSALDSGERCSRPVLERLACDCGVRLQVERDGAAVDVGRRSRKVPVAMQRAIRERDGHRCRFPGCTNRGSLHLHHRRHWARGGRTAADNVFLVCRYHHKVLHEGGWHANGDANGRLTFHAPGGRALPEAAPPGPHTDPGALRREHALAGAAIGPDTIVSRWDGSRLELGWTVGLLRDLDPPHPG